MLGAYGDAIRRSVHHLVSEFGRELRERSYHTADISVTFAPAAHFDVETVGAANDFSQ